ncbi:MAG: FAD:protein FMN transferase [Gammaproteobacteria bacterium]|nr:FAD:protein FMN transferase [Gammaproteobacteria bacterium]
MAIPKKFTFNFVCMTTPCEIILYAKTKSQAGHIAAKIEQNTRRLETKYNFFCADSFLSHLNNRSPQGPSDFMIDNETKEVLLNIKQLSLDTNGQFDISVGTLKQCSNLSSATDIEACRSDLSQFIGPDSWSISGNRLCFANDKVKLDLGGVIKEYAVDQAAIIARNANMPALINFGGDIYVNGIKPDNSPFTVAIKNPKNPTENIALIQLTDQGLTTSAHYERSDMVDGQQYSHIIGQPTEMGQTILSATVITDSVMTSGVYSTALMLDPSLEIISNIGVVLIDQQLRLHQNVFAQ